jgi:hypothetical protein
MLEFIYSQTMFTHHHHNFNKVTISRAAIALCDQSFPRPHEPASRSWIEIASLYKRGVSSGVINPPRSSHTNMNMFSYSPPIVKVQKTHTHTTSKAYLFVCVLVSGFFHHDDTLATTTLCNFFKFYFKLDSTNDFKPCFNTRKTQIRWLYQAGYYNLSTKDQVSMYLKILSYM